MVAGAWTLRQSWDGAGDGVALGPSEPLTVICVTELVAACDALRAEGVDVAVEDAATTADRLGSEPEAGAHGWLTLAPWDEIVGDRRDRAGLEPLATGGAVEVGWSPLVMALWEDRAAVLEQRCRDGLAWGCVGRLADRPWEELGGQPTWGTLKAIYPDPGTTASGLLVLGHAATDLFGRADLSTRELDSDRFRDWLDRLTSGVPSGAPARDVVVAMVRTPAVADVAGTTEAQAATVVARSAEGRRVPVLRYPDPPVVTAAVLAPLADDRSEQLRGMVEQIAGPALARAGWRVEGQPVAEGLDEQLTRPDESGLPSAGALEALRARYEEFSR